jgi:predicted metalloprotease
VKIEGRRRSSNFEDRGRGSGGGGALPVRAVASLVRVLGFKGTLIVAALLGVGFFFLSPQAKQQLIALLAGGGGGSEQAGSGSACEASNENLQACDFSRVVLASTEDVWSATFRADALPKYGEVPGAYREPVLVVFAASVSTGCGDASSDVGPFYCPRDGRLYIDPSFYQVMEQRLRAPGDFAQAYVIAHEVGHHVQHLMGATGVKLSGETENQTSVRVELQADCLAGVWGHTAQASLEISEEDLSEAVNAAHAIGDDALGHADEDDFTHGTSEQRKRWFRRGFQGGDASQCDTFAVQQYGKL